MNQVSLLDRFLESSESFEIYYQMECVLCLLLKYGGKLKLPVFLQGIKEVDKGMYDLIMLLDNYKILDTKKLSSMVRDFKSKLWEKNSLFCLKSNSDKLISKIDSLLKTKFGKHSLSFEKNGSDDLVLDLEGNGYSYKRSLDGDVDNLLK